MFSTTTRRHGYCPDHTPRWNGTQWLDYSAGTESCYACERHNYENEDFMCDGCHEQQRLYNERLCTACLQARELAAAQAEHATQAAAWRYGDGAMPAYPTKPLPVVVPTCPMCKAAATIQHADMGGWTRHDIVCAACGHVEMDVLWL